MHLVPESQILNKSVPQFTRNTVQSMLLLSDQTNSMTRTSHLSKILFAEIQIIITRIEFTKFSQNFQQTAKFRHFYDGNKGAQFKCIVHFQRGSFS